jgi:hypothetical protein
MKGVLLALVLCIQFAKPLRGSTDILVEMAHKYDCRVEVSYQSRETVGRGMIFWIEMPEGCV